MTATTLKIETAAYEARKGGLPDKTDDGLYFFDFYRGDRFMGRRRATRKLYVTFGYACSNAREIARDWGCDRVVLA